MGRRTDDPPHGGSHEGVCGYLWLCVHVHLPVGVCKCEDVVFGLHLELCPPFFG